MIGKYLERVRPFWPQFCAVITATFGSVSNGMEYGWPSPAVPILLEESSPVRISKDDAYWIQTLYILGGVCAIPITFTLLQFIGRKKTIIISACLCLICWILVATATNIPQLFTARFISGMGANFGFVGIPMYNAEISEPKIRGFLGTLIGIMAFLGVLIGYCIVPFIPIYASSLVGAVLALLQLCTISLRPESPYYLLIKNRKEEARKELKKLRYREDIDDELEEIAKAVQRQNSERGRPIDMIIIPSNRKALIVMTVLNCAQNLCGCTVIIMNMQTILETSGTVISAQLSAILFAITMLLSSMFGSILIDKFGRKVLLTSSSILSALFLGILGGFFLMKECQGYDISDYTWIPLFASISYAFSFRYGLGLVPIVVTAELFPTSVKAMGMVVSDLMFTIMATISLTIYSSTVTHYGMYFPFLLFCLFGVLTAIFVMTYIPETKGKSLEEIQMILKGEVVKNGNTREYLEEYREEKF